jgi:hypothetical protein
MKIQEQHIQKAEALVEKYSADRKLQYRELPVPTPKAKKCHSSANQDRWGHYQPAGDWNIFKVGPYGPVGTKMQYQHIKTAEAPEEKYSVDRKLQHRELPVPTPKAKKCYYGGRHGRWGHYQPAEDRKLFKFAPYRRAGVKI